MLIKRSIALFIVILIFAAGLAQQVNFIYRNSRDSLQNFYVVRPPVGKAAGGIILIQRGLSDSSKKIAYSKGILLMTVVLTNNDLDLFMDTIILKQLDSMINEAIVKYKVPAGKIVIGGMSVAGTAAIRYAEYCAGGNSVFHFKPAAIVAVDSPLDYERLFNESENAILRNYNQDAVSEGQQLTAFFKTKMRGTPDENRLAYQQASPFSHTAKQGGNASILKDTRIRIYTEPDINWWIENRRKDFYDLNVLDIAAFINQLKLIGNNKVELMVTNKKGYTTDGNRHPHSWSIVNEGEFLNWCLHLFNAVQ